MDKLLWEKVAGAPDKMEACYNPALKLSGKWTSGLVGFVTREGGGWVSHYIARGETFLKKDDAKKHVEREVNKGWELINLSRG